MFLKVLSAKKKINLELQKLIIKISKLFNLGYAGIDVKFDKNSYFRN